jgi:hypothetical protein
MIFEKGDEIIYNGNKRTCVISNEELAIFGTISKMYDENQVMIGISTSFENLIAFDNKDVNEDLINFKRV